MRWTQWIFLQLFERGLAYESEVPVNWCPDLGTVLANEEVEEWRAKGFPVERRPMRQWMLKITEYAERLLEDLDGLDWPESIKEMQRNWIGKSEGAEVDFALGRRNDPRVHDAAGHAVRRDLHGAGAGASAGGADHRAGAARGRGGLSGRRRRARATWSAPNWRRRRRASSPAPMRSIRSTARRFPIWIADYVLWGYGTGAIMAVPAHDARDFEFAQKFGLPIVQVVQPPEGVDWHGYVGDGIAVNSGEYDGLPTAGVQDARSRPGWKQTGQGEGKVNYKLRDWLFSRQRYWGEPFPLLHCDEMRRGARARGRICRCACRR